MNNTKKMHLIICLTASLLCIFYLMGCAGKMKGCFYSLEEAYAKGLLGQEDVKKIAYYQNYNIDYPFNLDKEIEKNIQEDYTSIKPRKNKNIDVYIDKYYGTYGRAVVIMISDNQTDYAAVMREVFVANVLFKYNNGNSICVWISEEK